LSHYEEKCASKMKSKKAGMVLRSLPPEKAFHFFKHSEYCCSAHSLDELAELLKSVQEESIIFHIERGDFSRWIADVIGDKELAKEVARCKDRDELVELVERRKEELWNLLR